MWAADARGSLAKDIAKMDHSTIDTQLQATQIDWQNSTTLAVTGNSKSIYLWNVEKPQSPIQTFCSSETIEQIKWNPKGLLLASCSTDYKVCLWSPDQPMPIHTFEGHNARLNLIQWSPSSMLMAGYSDGAIKLWDAESKEKLAEISLNESVQNLDVSPDCQTLVGVGN